jgi:beta-phosphoglucomutase
MTGAVLWDLDGTLVDSEEYHWRAWQETMSAEGVVLTREQFRATFGRRNDSILQQWLGREATADRIRHIADSKEELYRRLISQDRPAPLPGAAEWVKRLASEGWVQAVASSAPRANVEVVLQVLALSPYFQALASAEDVSRGKPDPEVFLTAAARLKVAPAQSIVVEDAAAGIEAARRAGMHSIGVSRNGAPLAADLVVLSLDAMPSDAFADLLAMPLR